MGPYAHGYTPALHAVRDISATSWRYVEYMDIRIYQIYTVYK